MPQSPPPTSAAGETAPSAPPDRPSPIPWPPILLVAALLAAILLGRVVPLSWPGLDDTPARIVGLAIGAFGIALIAWAAWTMHQARTTILPHRGSDALVTSGPFWRFRNPIYLGDTMIILSLAELTKNIWYVPAGIAFALFVTFLAILPEERYLEARFGDAYRAYKARSRRWL
jgi:protein-S-isoprenylcysteine O-methyltransferase Ste14